MGKPAILFLNRVYPPVRGATGRLLRDLAEAFAQKGWAVTVISSGPEKGETQINGVRILRVKGPEKPGGVLPYMWIWLKMLILALRVKAPDLLVSMSDPPLLIVACDIVAKIKRARHINWCQDLYPDVMPALGMRVPDLLMRGFRFLRIRAMQRADRIIPCGRCMAAHIERDGIDGTKIRTIPNWPDPELTDGPATDAGGAAYRKVNPAIARSFQQQIKRAQRFRVLYAGNIGLAHPVDGILEAAAIFERENSDIEFVFVGDGPRFDAIAAQRAEKHLDNVRLLPYQPAANLHETMESGDVHLISMAHAAEGFVVPSKLYAALAVARPCIFIGPPDCEVARVIREYGCGRIVAQGDIDAFIDAVRQYRYSAESWFAAHHAAAQACNDFTRARATAAWLECADSAVP